MNTKPKQDQCNLYHASVYFDECNKRWETNGHRFMIGPNDLDLMKRLRNAGTDHRKFMRMISTTLQNPETGQIVGTAALEQTAIQAACLGAFTAMSIASGQYFLAEINGKLNMMRLSLDKILEFLYGDKRAELLSEISFIRFAYENYGSRSARKHNTEKCKRPTDDKGEKISQLTNPSSERLSFCSITERIEFLPLFSFRKKNRLFYGEDTNCLRL